MCESVDVSTATPGVFAFPLWMKTHTYVHAHTHAQTVQVLCVISGGKVKTYINSAVTIALFSAIRPSVMYSAMCRMDACREGSVCREQSDKDIPLLSDCELVSLLEDGLISRAL